MPYLSRPDQRKQAKWMRYLLKRQHGRCAYCSREMIKGHAKLHPTFDHVQARSRGGVHHLENGKAACRECNQAKGALSFYRPRIHSG